VVTHAEQLAEVQEQLVVAADRYRELSTTRRLVVAAAHAGGMTDAAIGRALGVTPAMARRLRVGG